MDMIAFSQKLYHVDSCDHVKVMLEFLSVSSCFTDKGLDPTAISLFNTAGQARTICIDVDVFFTSIFLEYNSSSNPKNEQTILLEYVSLQGWFDFTLFLRNDINKGILNCLVEAISCSIIPLHFCVLFWYKFWGPIHWRQIKKINGPR